MSVTAQQKPGISFTLCAIEFRLVKYLFDTFRV